MNTKSIQPAIKLILRCLPTRPNPNVQEAYDFLNRFATAPLGGSNINSFNTTMGQVSTYLQKMLDGFRCYRKNFQLMGNIVQGYVKTICVSLIALYYTIASFALCNITL